MKNKTSSFWLVQNLKKHLPILLVLLLAAALRLYSLDKFPAGLNADEAAIGYNAYSLLETGKDEHGAAWPLVFRSFDDYKPSLYFYLVLPFVKAFGLNVWSVRLPSAILGIASVYLIYLLTNQLFNQGKGRTLTGGVLNDGLATKGSGRSDLIGLLAALILAISPWHLHFSRGGWEANAACFLTIWGVWAFIKALNKPKYFYLSALSFVLSLYAYHSMRVISPLLFLSLVVVYWSKLKPLVSLKTINKHLALSVVLGIFLLIPVTKQMFDSQGTSRFAGVSVFSDQGPLWEALERRRQSPNSNSIQTRLIHNKYLTYSRRFLSNYLSHYSPRFLFITGDEIARSKVPGMGQSYLLLAPFYLLGILSLLKVNTKGKKVVLFWFLVAPLAAALTFQSPHALRAQNMVIPLSIITSLGIYQFFIYLKNNKLVSLVSTTLFFTLLTYSTTRYLHQYYVHYPQELGFAWQYGFQEVANYVKENGNQYDSIIISNRYDQPYIIMAFFMQYPPDKFQQEIELVPRDKFGFSTVNAFGKFKFKAINWELDSQEKNALIITTEEGVPEGTELIHQVLFPSGEPAFKFYKSTHI
jgi:4-amino-4-deoxy-L-arabinose transferase-like glycosyltransferase